MGSSTPFQAPVLQRRNLKEVENIESNPLWKGFGWGIIATFVMTILMITGKATGLAPMPEPISIAAFKHLIGEAPKPILMILGLISHFVYGGIFGGLLTQLFQP